MAFAQRAAPSLVPSLQALATKRRLWEESGECYNVAWASAADVGVKQASGSTEPWTSPALLEAFFRFFAYGLGPGPPAGRAAPGAPPCGIAPRRAKAAWRFFGVLPEGSLRPAWTQVGAESDLMGEPGGGGLGGLCTFLKRGQGRGCQWRCQGRRSLSLVSTRGKPSSDAKAAPVRTMARAGRRSSPPHQAAEKRHRLKETRGWRCGLKLSYCGCLGLLFTDRDLVPGCWTSIAACRQLANPR